MRSKTVGMVGVALLVGAAGVAIGGAGEGIQLGQLVLRPYVDLSGTYDSNVRQSAAGEDGDVLGTGELGLESRFDTSNLDLELDAFLSSSRYAEESDLDYEAGGETLRVNYARPEGLFLNAIQSYRRVEDLDLHREGIAVSGFSADTVLDASSRQRRDILQAGVAGGTRLTDKVDLEVGYNFDQIDYAGNELMDVVEHRAVSEVGVRVTDKTAALLTGVYGTQDVDGNAGDLPYVRGRVGLRTIGTDKLSFRGGVGVQSYDRSTADRETSAHYDVALTWLATDKLQVVASGMNGLQLSSLYANNAAEYAVARVVGGYRVFERTRLTLGGFYRQDDYLDPVPDSLVEREDKGVGVHARVDYQTPNRIVNLYAESSYQTVDSNVQDYDETRAMAGVRVQY